jgi:hypothetical protein
MHGSLKRKSLHACMHVYTHTYIHTHTVRRRCAEKALCILKRIKDENMHGSQKKRGLETLAQCLKLDSQCEHIFVYIYMYVCMHTCMRVKKRGLETLAIYTCMHACIPVYMHAYIQCLKLDSGYESTCMHACICVYLCVYVKDCFTI